MRHLLTALRARAAARVLAQTTFCDACASICTPQCRRDAVRAAHRDRATGITFRL